MNFFGMFSKKKNVQNIQVTDRKHNILHDTAAAVAFSDEGEHEIARSLVDKTRGSSTILMIVNGDNCSPQLQDYALEMADRLDYKLMALHVTELPFSLAGEKKEAAIEAFRNSCLDSLNTLQRKADAIGVSISTVVECGEQDEVVARLHAQYPGMRYVLTEPDPGIVRNDTGRTAIPVFDLGSFQPSAA